MGWGRTVLSVRCFAGEVEMRLKGHRELSQREKVVKGARTKHGSNRHLICPARRTLKGKEYIFDARIPTFDLQGTHRSPHQAREPTALSV
ncbi:hypothetical protein NDU88_002010 [Pleurodeles waltl]|uniref:Uncharacterized protein n=1 Tax=Pleurodeles waltl TaxID=8319 RepID=A0AAV7P5W6_PLEWA|nr:hypothetical protein NDU88_002010 [Pleurodeles waltl]